MGQPLFVFTVSMAHSKDRHNPLCILRNTLEISILWPRPILPIYTGIGVFVATSMTTPIERTNNDQWELLAFNYIDATKSNFLNCCRSNRSICSIFFFFSLPLSSQLFRWHFKEENIVYSWAFVWDNFWNEILEWILIRFKGVEILRMNKYFCKCSLLKRATW